MTTPTRQLPRRRWPSGDPIDRWVAPDVAASALGVSARTIRRRCLEGSLRCVNWGTGWVVAADELAPPIEPDRG